MRKFTVELDDMICMWLEHIWEVTGESIEKLIDNGIYRQVTLLEDGAYKIFGVYEATQ